jgi:hypothetical protein
MAATGLRPCPALTAGSRTDPFPYVRGGRVAYRHRYSGYLDPRCARKTARPGSELTRRRMAAHQETEHHRRVRDALGVLLVAVGLTWALLTRDKLGLVIAFAGVTLLAYGVLRPSRSSRPGDPEPPVF